MGQLPPLPEISWVYHINEHLGADQPRVWFGFMRGKPVATITQYERDGIFCWEVLGHTRSNKTLEEAKRSISKYLDGLREGLYAPEFNPSWFFDFPAKTRGGE